MADEKEENTSAPTPLSLEGGTMQMELETKPKPADKNTRINSQTKGLIDKIVSTPKETGSTDPSEPKSTASSTSSSSGSSSSSAPPTHSPDILTKLNSEENTGGSGSKGPPPTKDETNDTAGMIIDGFNAIFVFCVQLWSKNEETEDYEVETEEKSKLKKYLSAIFVRNETKINPLWVFIGLLFVMYVPKLRKGYKHKKMVDEQREKDKPGTIFVDGQPRKKRRKRSDGYDNVEYAHAEVIR